MILESPSPNSFNLNNITSDLLQLTLSASRAGLFFSPVSAGKKVAGSDVEFERHSAEAWSLNVSELFGLSETIKDATDLLPYMLEDDRENLFSATMQAIEEKSTECDCEYRIRLSSGDIRWILSRMHIGCDAYGEMQYIASMVFDITEQKQEQERLEQLNDRLEKAQSLLHTALKASDIAIFRQPVRGLAESKQRDIVFDTLDEEDRSWNFNLDRLYGYSAGTNVTRELQLKRMQEEDYKAIIQKAGDSLKADHIDFQHEYPIQLDDQSKRWLLLKCTADVDDHQGPAYLSGAVIDITSRKLAEEKTNYLATHDALTGLPNRRKFNELMSHTIKTAKRYAHSFAVLFIDLDRFKSINDALGHQAGDQLLIDITRRIKSCIRASDCIARFSGDEFVLLAPEISDSEAASILAEKVIAEVCKPVDLQGHICQVTASVGISLFPCHGETEEVLLKHADSAMYQAKAAGKNNYQVFDAARASHSLKRMSMENALRSALEHNELHLEYQAMLDLQQNAVAGVEALLRWNSDEFGSVPPARFIPIAEEAGLIVPIGQWVLKKACQQNMDWQKQGLPPICMSVNVSARQFLNPNFIDHIKEALDASGMEPQLLELEITESMVMHRVDEALAQIQAIKKLGALIAIDDFGTGYSSLAQLKRFPIDTLKVDRSFIRDVVHDVGDQAITEAIIAMGKSMNLTVIAEGVETREQQEFLRERACDEIQGYYFSRPVIADECSKILHQYAKSVIQE